MKPYRILKTFKGSQTGHDHDEFVAGTTRDLSKELAAVVVKEGWAELAEPSVTSDATSLQAAAEAEAARLRAEHERAEQERLRREDEERQQRERDEQTEAENAKRAEAEAVAQAEREKAEAEVRAQQEEAERLAALAKAEADQKASQEQGNSHPETRETKVITPAETKPAKPLEKMSKAELADHARTLHGLELDPEAMKAKEMIAAIEAATAA